MARIAIYPGSFDPITHGHLDIIRRAAHLFDDLVVAVAASDAKKPWLELAQRLQLVTMLTQSITNVRVCVYRGLTVELARAEGALALVRGLRSSQDLEYELQLAYMNQQMAPEIETIFLLPNERHRLVSASIVREIAKMGGDLSAFVDERVAAVLLALRY